ncbi:MAG: DUF58 domain-containing protein [Candidatus Nitrohelix vancouverensis]|uniref:DUF58 domain-containing protein n=1 Tax=Candidatus Nitrohelix vancouverensis TaxID=2705534 RepID=A0A7T0C4R4_9BACT|nr:MAG: DUF58 domain-containing protein [Candidatus Nitrohelix vancouverensis]
MKEELFEYNPQILARISSLKIRASHLVDGLLTGSHRSRHKGSSVEFAEYKDYTPGDEIKHIDWKVVGKTDKYHVKQFEQSTNLKCSILLDASGSMGYASPFERELSKFDYACTLAAAFSFLLLKQFDAVGLSLFNDGLIDHIPPRSKPSHFQHILHKLATIETQGPTRIEQVATSLAERSSGRGMAIIISDLLTPDDQLPKALKLLTSRGLEVMLFQVLDPDEVSLPFEGDTVFESLEDDPTVGLDPFDIRAEYQQEIQNQIQSHRSACDSIGVGYEFLETTTPLAQALSYFLLKRNSWMQRWS